jgi:hypothetical protein
LENFFDPESQTVGFRQAVDFGVAKPGSEKSCQLPKSIKTLIVHFGDDDSIEAGKDAVKPIWERMQMAQVQRRDVFRAIHSFADWTKS